MKKSIGIVKLEYSEDGSLKTGEFHPFIGSKFTPLDLEKLKEVEDFDKLKSHSETLLGKWFSEVNDIELADREKFEIKSITLDCKKFDRTGNVKFCVIEYFLTEKEHS